jgi:8-oxo-dGTP pyrophosphatase MutT (NUDIX family)
MTAFPDIFAVFAIVRKGDGFAATTRPDGRIGLPGGKVDDGESPRQALRRECEEEGWKLTSTFILHHVDMVEGKKVAWFACRPNRALKLRNFKEKYRGIRPIVASGATLASNGMGNDFLL